MDRHVLPRGERQVDVDVGQDGTKLAAGVGRRDDIVSVGQHNVRVTRKHVER